MKKYKKKILIVARGKTTHYKEGKYDKLLLSFHQKKREAADSGTASLKHWKKKKKKPYQPPSLCSVKISLNLKMKQKYFYLKNWMYLSTADLDYKNIKGNSSGGRE